MPLSSFSHPLYRLYLPFLFENTDSLARFIWSTKISNVLTLMLQFFIIVYANVRKSIAFANFSTPY